MQDRCRRGTVLSPAEKWNMTNPKQGRIKAEHRQRSLVRSNPDPHPADRRVLASRGVTATRATASWRQSSSVTGCAQWRSPLAGRAAIRSRRISTTKRFPTARASCAKPASIPISWSVTPRGAITQMNSQPVPTTCRMGRSDDRPSEGCTLAPGTARERGITLLQSRTRNPSAGRPFDNVDQRVRHAGHNRAAFSTVRSCRPPTFREAVQRSLHAGHSKCRLSRSIVTRCRS